MAAFVYAWKCTLYGLRLYPERPLNGGGIRQYFATLVPIQYPYIANTWRTPCELRSHTGPMQDLFPTLYLPDCTGDWQPETGNW